MPSSLTLGIDEAGRGCVLGPLVVAIVAATEYDKRLFCDWNVRDSKLIPAHKRDALAARIKDRCWHVVRVAHPPEIDDAIRDRSRTLNGLERDMMAELLRVFQAAHPDAEADVFVDAPSSNAEGFRQQLLAVSGWQTAERLRALHRADEKHRPVGAASVLAKTERERILAEIKKEIGIDFGSGYCHDERTIRHLKTVSEDAVHVRWTWATAGSRS